ncbi:MAG TPA: hypothetical protein H9685_08620 [Firmicutes bacterium]|nr:hypothetical protein [Bacillota bacterium]
MYRRYDGFNIPNNPGSRGGADARNESTARNGSRARGGSSDGQGSRTSNSENIHNQRTTSQHNAQNHNNQNRGGNNSNLSRLGAAINPSRRAGAKNSNAFHETDSYPSADFRNNTAPPDNRVDPQDRYVSTGVRHESPAAQSGEGSAYGLNFDSNSKGGGLDFIDKILDLLPQGLYNRETGKFLGIATGEELLIGALILLILSRRESEDDTLLLIALIYILVF